MQAGGNASSGLSAALCQWSGMHNPAGRIIGSRVRGDPLPNERLAVATGSAIRPSPVSASSLNVSSGHCT